MSIAAAAAASMPLTRGVGLGGGWLSMAPQTDDAPSAPQQPVGVINARHDSNHASPSAPASAVQSPVVPPPRVSTTLTNGARPIVVAKAASSVEPPAQQQQEEQQKAKSAFSQQAVKPVALARSIVPRTKARFSVGDTTSQAGTPASVTPPSPPIPGSGGGDGDDSPPPFDVRNSFAPMRWGAAGPTISSRRTSEKQDGHSGNRLTQGQTNAQSKTNADKRREENDDEDDHDDDEDEAERVVYAGRKWKGKTAHAIELEMEALGDRTVMSYAPDAVYLASRLEGLRRNLEAGGERFRRRMWEDLEAEEQADHVMHDEGTLDKPPSPAPLEERTIAADVVEQPTSYVKSSPFHSTSRLASGQLSPVHEVPLGSSDAPAASVAAPPSAAPSMSATSSRTIDPAAKEAALDARVEIRTLRRPDLEQVRELHCYHGSGDKVDTETYTTSAAFLLRLLVDEHYVCLVAVAKPLPEPPALPTGHAPRPPPPSLDMPAARSLFLLAGRQTSAARIPRGPADRRASSGLVDEGTLLHDAPAPRSFGVGPASSENASSLVDTSDEEEQMRQESLFERAKAASTYVTGDTSPPLDDEGDVDESMPDIAEEDEVAVSETENGVDIHQLPQFSSPFGAASRRKSSSVASRNSVLAGPTFDVAPPRAIRVMGAPPMGGRPVESETILGVASARIKVVQRTVDDFESQANEWVLGAPQPPPTNGRDASWPGLDPNGERSMVTREAHIMTLSVLPGERGQGLGARLLDRLMDECKRRTAGPRIHLAAGSNSIEEGHAAPPRAHQDAPMRSVLEIHPSNTSAMQLYQARAFRQVLGNKGVLRHFFRGDQRIPSAIRLKAGGSDAVRMERIDLPSG